MERATGAMLALFLLLPVVLGANPYWKFQKDDLAKVHCRDGTTCPRGNTCCELSDGTYGCCPQPNAVCCSDHKHCCPEGYQCDVEKNTCTKAGIEEEVTLQEIVLNVDITCPDGSQCPDGDTCCLTTEGHYGCCPQPNAVCCSDGKHCCPEGYQCDVESGTCIKGATAQIFSLVKHVKNVKDVHCPGDEYSCPDGDTCCPQSDGGYGCCPLPDANCCSDGVHCCPSGYTCDLAAGTCLKSSVDCDKATGNCPDGAIVDSPELTEAREHTDVKNDVKNVICPGGEYYCPDGDTCCNNGQGGYGCCPLPNAVCCSDHVHCCPSGDTCASGYCLKSSLGGLEERIPFLKSPASRRL